MWVEKEGKSKLTAKKTVQKNLVQSKEKVTKGKENNVSQKKSKTQGEKQGKPISRKKAEVLIENIGKIDSTS